jgi:hypothetical protein
VKTTLDPRPVDSAGAAINLRLPQSPPDVRAKLAELVAAIASHDRRRYELLMDEIAGLAAREERAERAAKRGGKPTPKLLEVTR